MIFLFLQLQLFIHTHQINVVLSKEHFSQRILVVAQE